MRGNTLRESEPHLHELSLPRMSSNAELIFTPMSYAYLAGSNEPVIYLDDWEINQNFEVNNLRSFLILKFHRSVDTNKV